MVDVSKRGILKAAAGLSAAMASNARDVGPTPLPHPPQAWTSGRETCAGDTFGPDPVKQAAVNLARAQLEKDQSALHRKRRSLERLKSVSRAWVEAQCEQIDRQENALYRAFQNLFGDADDMIPF